MTCVPYRRQENAESLAAEGRRVRDALVSKRSDTLLRLFDFLLERSVEGFPPKEMEIASAVFGDTIASSQGTVRVYVHRLRKKLDQHYSDKTGARIQIPRGEYCIILADPDGEIAMELSELEPAPKTHLILRRKYIAVALIVLVAANAVIAAVFFTNGRPEPDPIARSAFWARLAMSERPKVVVMGDYYLIAEMQGGGKVTRLINDPSIKSREDLDVYLMRNPQDLGRFHDRDLHYAPSSAAVALRQVLPIMQALRGRKPDVPSLTLASQLSPGTVKAADIIYIGPLKALSPLLRNPLFQASGFKVGATYDELVDKASDRRFVSDGAVLADDRIPRRDYGYIAGLPGPSGNYCLFISGLRDPAVMQMAELVRDPARLEGLSKQIGKKVGAFEALFQVRTLGTTNLGSRLVVARSLDTGGIWDRPQASQRFPDEVYEVDRER